MSCYWNANPSEQREESSMISIVESVHGTWFYHLRDKENGSALCGATVMQTSIPLSAWGVRTALGERWCNKCREASRIELPQ
jgi:hypothetical protein